MAFGLTEILGIANAGLGVSGSLAQQRAARDAQRRAEADRRRALKLQEEQYARNQELFRQMEASGQFDPRAQQEAIGNLMRHDLGLQQGQVAANAAMRGYRPGDTAPNVQSQRFSEGHNLRLAQVMQNISQQAMQRRLQAQSLNDPSQLANSLMQMSQMNQQIGNQQSAQASANMGGELSGALSMLPMGRSQQPRQTQPMGAQPSGYGGYIPYDGYVPGENQTSGYDEMDRKYTLNIMGR